MEASPEVSVVIVCMNRPDNLYPCLKSVRDNTSVSHEVLVVAYMFSPDNLAKAKEDFPEVVFIENNELSGFAENNNLALRTARGKYCFVLNDDTEFHKPLIDNLLKDFEKLPPKAAIVSPKLVNPDGSLQLCGRCSHDGWHYLLQQWHLWSEKKDNVSGKIPVARNIFRSQDITGACFLIKTSVFRELGWFDETYYFTPEDMALSTLAIRKGYGVYVDASAEVVHKWKTTASRISPAVRPSAVRGSLIFFSRGSSLRYLALGAGVWVAEFCKLCKASLKRDESRHVFRNIVRSIFTRRTPKEIFIKYYNELRKA